MSLTMLIITIAIGLILLTLEMVALPGGIAGIFGALLLGFGVFQTYGLYGTTAGNIVLIGSIVLCVILLCIMLKTKTWKKFSLHEESDSKVNQINEQQLSIGMQGKTIARLVPTGKASFNGELYEVHAINNFIDPNKDIEIVAIEGYRIDVKEIEQ